MAPVKLPKTDVVVIGLGAAGGLAVLPLSYRSKPGPKPDLLKDRLQLAGRDQEGAGKEEASGELAEVVELSGAFRPIIG